MTIMQDVEEHRKKIRYEPITFSISEVISMYLADPKEIIISPDFQRLFRWSREQQSNFIESLLLEIPIPPLFFFENEDGFWELLDGLQRISTLIRFMGSNSQVPDIAQGVSGNEEDWHYENENNLETPLQLLSGDYLKSLEGHTFRNLPTKLQLNLKRARLHVFVLKRETHKLYKYEVFKRLNGAGTVLDSQELRNCSIRLFDDSFPDYLQKIASYENFVEALGYRKSFENEKLALRFFAMKNNSKAFKHDVDPFLSHYMEEVARNTLDFDKDKEEVLFKKTFDLINKALGSSEAFRGKTAENKSLGPFSPSLFESVSIGVANNIDYIEGISPEKLKIQLIDLIKILKDKSLTGAGSNSRHKTMERLKTAITHLRSST
jgi:uncharacterized protein DUF262